MLSRRQRVATRCTSLRCVALTLCVGFVVVILVILVWPGTQSIVRTPGRTPSRRLPQAPRKCLFDTARPPTPVTGGCVRVNSSREELRAFFSAVADYLPRDDLVELGSTWFDHPASPWLRDAEPEIRTKYPGVDEDEPRSGRGSVSLEDFAFSLFVEVNQPAVKEFNIENEHYLEEYSVYEKLFWKKILGWMMYESVVLNRPPRRVLDVGAAYCSLAFFTYLLSGKTAHVNIVDILTQQDFHRRLLKTYKPDFELDTFRIEVDSLVDEAKKDGGRSSVYPDKFPNWAVPKSYDWIIFTEIIEHLNFYQAPALARLRRLLKPGGLLFLSTVAVRAGNGSVAAYQDRYECPVGGYDGRVRVEIGHYHEFALDEMRHVIQEGGFVILREARRKTLHEHSFEFILTRDQFDWHRCSVPP